MRGILAKEIEEAIRYHSRSAKEVAFLLFCNEGYARKVLGDLVKKGLATRSKRDYSESRKSRYFVYTMVINP